MRPNLPEGTRVFLGNLASEATSKAEIREIFEKHGPVEEVILRGSFGFVQYFEPRAAQEAIAKENGRIVAGRKIDVQLSRREPKGADDRRGSRGAPPGAGGPGAGRRSRSPPRRDSYRDPARDAGSRDSLRGPLPPPHRDIGREHDRDRDRGYRDDGRAGHPYDRRPASPDRRYRDGPERDARDPYDRRDLGRHDSYGGRPEDRDRYDRPPTRDSRYERRRTPPPYGGSRDYLRRSRSRSPVRGGGYDDPRRTRSPGVRGDRYPPGPARRELDCMVLVLAREQRHYASYAMNRIIDVGLETDMIVLDNRSLPAEIHDLVVRGVPFACVIGANDETARTVSVSLLKRNPPEDFHGVPIEDALRILSRECELWRQAQAELARAALAAQPPQPPAGPRSPPRTFGGGMPAPPRAPAPGGAEDEEELLAKQAQIQANILNILKQAGTGAGTAAGAGAGSQAPNAGSQPPAGQPTMPTAPVMSMPTMPAMPGMPPRPQMQQMGMGPMPGMPAMAVPFGMPPGAGAMAMQPRAPFPPGLNGAAPTAMGVRPMATPFMPLGMPMPPMPPMAGTGAPQGVPSASAGAGAGGGAGGAADPSKIDKAFSDLLLLKQTGFFNKDKS